MLKNFSLIDLIKKRKSIRKYKDLEVPEDVIRSCIEAARLAPSAENSQPWRFVIIQNKEKIKELGKKAFSGIFSPTSFASNAPVLIIVLAKLDILANKLGKFIRNVSFYQIDIGIAVEHLVLRAAEQGLGTCWIGWFNESAVRKFLNIPKIYKIPVIISMGYPQDLNIKSTKRLSLEDIILKWEK